MSSLSMVEAKLPPGFRFHPRDDELICDYLIKRFASCDTSLLIEVDLNKCEPWDLPGIACIGGKEWYFYSQRDRKYATGLRTNRATVSGYWKATGKDRAVSRNGSLVGMRKTLVFYQGRAPKGKKTEWVMHEFRLEAPQLGPPKLPPSKEDWVLCRVFHKSREQPGKPAIMAHSTSTSSYEMEPSSSSLPALMDSYINFDHNHQITSVRDDNNNNNNNNNNNISNDSYEHVPCFSIFNQNQTNPPTLSQLFKMEPNNIATTKNNIIINNTMGLYHTTTTTPPTPFGSHLQNGLFTTASNAATMSTSDKQVIKAVLSQLTKMEGASPASNNMKGSSSISLGEAASSESYLSDVGLPTMWSNHY